tara:strand:- start:235 stop:879 length:645 start_codon:yes stop_codon:yes gene_type:complete
MSNLFIIFPYLEEFYIIALIHLLAVMSPGPDFFVVLKQSLNNDRKSAILTSLGIGLGILIHVIYCILGVGFLIYNNLFLYSIIKYLGAIYLLYLGAASFLNSYDYLELNKINENEKLHFLDKPFYVGFITNILNPKATLFFLSIFSVIINQSTPISIKIFYGLWMSIITSIWFCLISLCFTSKISKIFIKKYAILINKIMGIILIIISLRMVFT